MPEQQPKPNVFDYEFNPNLYRLQVPKITLGTRSSNVFVNPVTGTFSVNDVGGSYQSNAEDPRVRIFPPTDTTIGLQVTDDTGANVFLAEVGGTNVGDVTIGDYAGGQGVLYDKSANTLTVSGALSAGTIDIGGADATSFHVDSGGNMWLGNAAFASAPFKVSSAGAITATSGTIGGSTLASSTITGGNFRTASSGARSELTGTGLKVYNSSGVQIGDFSSATTGGYATTFNAAAGKMTGGVLLFGQDVPSVSDIGANDAAIGFESTLGDFSLSTFSSSRTNQGIALIPDTGKKVTVYGELSSTTQITVVGDNKLLMARATAAATRNISIYNDGSASWLDHNGLAGTSLVLSTDNSNGPIILFPGTSTVRIRSDSLSARYLSMYHDGTDGVFSTVGTGELYLTPAGSSVRPGGETGTINLGTSTKYWNDVSFKSFTDRGCLGWFDDGVEMPDGTKVSDTEAIMKIKKRKDGKKTIYGAPMLDYKTFPKVSYKEGEKEKIKGKTVVGDDGIEMTSMFSIMIGAIRELTDRVKKLEQLKFR